VRYFLKNAMDAHPELAAAYVISATRIFEEKGVAFGPLDGRLRDLASSILRSDGREEQLIKYAISAINRLAQRVVKPGA